VLGGDLSKPMAKPKGGLAGPSGRALSDDFSADRMGVQWTFHAPAADEAGRAVYEPKGLRIKGRGASPADSSPLTCIVGDRAYEVEITIALKGEAEGGLLLFYNHKAFVGLGFTPSTLKTFEYSEELVWARKPHEARLMRLRIGNDGNVVTYHYSYDEGRTWRRHDTRMEVSGFHHNVFGGFLSLTIGVYSAGDGEILVQDFNYRALA
jgi:xylan 1,4-beta-xylosidase